MLKAYVVDDHPICRWGLKYAVEDSGEFEVTGMFGSAGEVLAGWDAPGPDLVLLDLYLADDLPCLPLAAELATRAPVLIISPSRRVEDVAACRRAGASGFLHKSADTEMLVGALHACLRGEPRFTDLDEDETWANPLSHLSPRELEVLTYIAEGYTQDQTARRLGLSHHTVDTYLRRLRTKIGVGNKAHLTRIAVAAGIRLANVHEMS